MVAQLPAGHAPTAAELLAWYNVINSFSSWPSYTPTLYTASATTRAAMAGTTVNHAEYLAVGNICYFNTDVLAGATSTGGVSLSLPFTAAERWLNCGTAVLAGTAVPAETGNPATGMNGCAYMSGSLDSIVIVSYTNAFLNITSGQTMRMAGFYRI